MVSILNLRQLEFDCNAFHPTKECTDSFVKNTVCIFKLSQGMSGQGWVWIGTDGVTSTPLSNLTHPDVKKSMQGAIGIAPRGKISFFCNASLIIYVWTILSMINGLQKSTPLWCSD